MLYSRLTAHEVANVLLYYRQEHPGDYVGIEVVEGQGPNQESGLADLHIRLPDEVEKTTLDDRSEVVHCEDNEGKRVDVVLGKPSERQHQPAQFIVQ